MSETSKTAKIILVLYWGLRHNRIHIRSMVQYSTKMIFAVLDVSLMGLNIGETDKVFFTLMTYSDCPRDVSMGGQNVIAETDARSVGDSHPFCCGSHKMPKGGYR